MSISRDTEYTIMRLSGLSTDDKPTDVKSGSWFREIDTANEFMFDGTNWILQTEGGGGGGGAVVVTFEITLVNDVLAVSNASMTPSEVREAMKTNAVVGVLNMNAGDLQGEDVCGCAVIYAGNMGVAFRSAYVDVETGEIVYVITSNATSEIEYWVFNEEAYYG